LAKDDGVDWRGEVDGTVLLLVRLLLDAVVSLLLVVDGESVDGLAALFDEDDEDEDDEVPNASLSLESIVLGVYLVRE
jgi:hypothetical protein